MNTLQLLSFIISTLLIISTNGGNGYTSVGSCCAPKRMTTKLIASCPTYTDENTCLYNSRGKANKCKWIDCEDVGYCEWAEYKTGRNQNLEKLCSRQATKPKCINKVFAGSAACEWVQGTPPEDIIAAMDLMDEMGELDEDLDFGDLVHLSDLDDGENENVEKEFVVDSNGSNVSNEVKAANHVNLFYIFIGLICVCFIGSWLIYSSKSKNDEQNVKEHQPLLSGQV